VAVWKAGCGRVGCVVSAVGVQKRLDELHGVRRHVKDVRIGYTKHGLWEMVHTSGR
jgi:hypothetical protein